MDDTSGKIIPRNELTAVCQQLVKRQDVGDSGVQRQADARGQLL